MKRSQINAAYKRAKQCFINHGWVLPPDPQWDITDMGLGRFDKVGLVLINLCEEKEYCEKLMYAEQGQVTPLHAHHLKKEDIICRNGQLAIELWAGHPNQCPKGKEGVIKCNGVKVSFQSGIPLVLNAGERVTIERGMIHSFWPLSKECVIGEVSTANDDTNDNHFVDDQVGRYPQIEEDDAPLIRLISEKVKRQ